MHLPFTSTRGSSRERILRTFTKPFCRIGQDARRTRCAPRNKAGSADTEGRDVLRKQRKHSTPPIGDGSIRPEAWSVFIYSHRGRNRLSTGRIWRITGGNVFTQLRGDGRR